MINSYEAYLLFRALRIHYTNPKYDFHKNNGRVNNCSIAAFEKCSLIERNAYEKIARMKEPKTFMVGNMMFNPKKFAADFDNSYYFQYRKMLTNGRYLFDQDLQKLHKPFKSNFEGDVPPIMTLLLSDELSLYTACVLEKITGWTSNVTNPLLQEKLKWIKKSVDFFRYDVNLAKQSIINSMS